MRGTRPRTDYPPPRGRLIPAYAGNTPGLPAPRWTRQAHPRVCGEHEMTAIEYTSNIGSSPRMRGTRPGSTPGGHDPGLIPAYAGNTVRRSPTTSVTPAHPRVCGEHSLPGSRRLRSAGSSPRMRGTQVSTRSADEVRGLIPAYAGNTPGPYSNSTRPAAHPRVCGEHSSAAGVSSSGSGSSPRMRGTPVVSLVLVRGLGLIPAYAGNTARTSRSAGTSQAHPRVCGEHGVCASGVCEVRGSSPRMRGTPGLPGDWRDDQGLIPAYAGNTTPTAR